MPSQGESSTPMDFPLVNIQVAIKYKFLCNKLKSKKRLRQSIDDYEEKETRQKQRNIINLYSKTKCNNVHATRATKPVKVSVTKQAKKISYH